MRILVTGVETPVPEIVERLGQGHDLVTVAELPSEAERLPALLEGCAAVIHGGVFVPGLGEQEALDLATRRTYNLFQAAAGAGVERVVVLGTLEQFRHHPEMYRVSEDWPSRPPAELRPLCLYLGERICREFARERVYHAACLRLGQVVREEEVVGQPLDLTWVDPRDVARLVEQILALPLEGYFSRWPVVNVVAPFPNPRFPLLPGRRGLVFQFEHRFGFEGENPA